MGRWKAQDGGFSMVVFGCNGTGTPGTGELVFSCVGLLAARITVPPGEGGRMADAPPGEGGGMGKNLWGEDTRTAEVAGTAGTAWPWKGNWTLPAGPFTTLTRGGAASRAGEATLAEVTGAPKHMGEVESIRAVRMKD